MFWLCQKKKSLRFLCQFLSLSCFNFSFILLILGNQSINIGIRQDSDDCFIIFSCQCCHFDWKNIQMVEFTRTVSVRKTQFDKPFSDVSFVISRVLLNTLTAKSWAFANSIKSSFSSCFKMDTAA